MPSINDIIVSQKGSNGDRKLHFFGRDILLALYAQMITYKHAITMYKLFKTCQPEEEFINLNFQLNQNTRMQHINFFDRHKYESGKNTLLNRLSHLNNKIKKQWLNDSLNTFKVKCKRLFLQS